MSFLNACSLFGILHLMHESLIELSLEAGQGPMQINIVKDYENFQYKIVHYILVQDNTYLL